MRTAIIIFACALLLPDAAAAADAAADADPSAPTVENLYGGTRYRDPFASLLGSGSQGSGTQPPPEECDVEEDLDIHSLLLKGMMQDKTGPFALFMDPTCKRSLILKKDKKGRLRLADYQKNPIPQVRGIIIMVQKKVTLTTPDGDRQEFVLGENDEDDEDEDEEDDEDDLENEE